MSVFLRMRQLLVLLVMLSLVPLAQANIEPKRVIENSYDSLLQLIKDKKLVAGMAEQELLDLMEKELTPVVDFDRVAKKVMGKYARQASAQQMVEFTQVFKKTLVSTYSKGLENLDQLDTVSVSEPVVDDRGSRAKVPSEISLKGGQKYQVVYSLFEDNGRWLVENIVVEGVNIGLVFKNQFAHYMELHNRNIDKVVANWGK